MPKLTYADLVHHWEQLLLGLSAGAPARQRLERRRTELETAFGQARILRSRMDLLRSDLQRASPGLQAKMSRGEELATLVRWDDRRRHRRQARPPVVPA